MSLIKIIKQQLGLSVTPANNFTLDASADNGTMKLARGNAGATTQDILTVDALGKVSFPQNAMPAFHATNPNTSFTAAGFTTAAGFISFTDTPNSGFNATTGIFTVPLDGWYSFSVWTSCGQNSANSMAALIALGAATMQSMENIPPTPRGYITSVCSMIFKAAVGQQVSCRLNPTWVGGQPHQLIDGACLFAGSFLHP